VGWVKAILILLQAGSKRGDLQPLSSIAMRSRCPSSASDTHPSCCCLLDAAAPLPLPNISSSRICLPAPLLGAAAAAAEAAARPRGGSIPPAAAVRVGAAAGGAPSVASSSSSIVRSWGV